MKKSNKYLSIKNILNSLFTHLLYGLPQFLFMLGYFIL